jgi:hypothetical protein
MDNESRAEEMKGRFERSIAAHGGVLPDPLAAAWDGYLAALMEWGMLSPGGHERLLELLPRVPGNPVLEILSGEWNPK